MQRYASNIIASNSILNQRSPRPCSQKPFVMSLCPHTDKDDAVRWQWSGGFSVNNLGTQAITLRGTETLPGGGGTRTTKRVVLAHVRIWHASMLVFFRDEHRYVLLSFCMKSESIRADLAPCPCCLLF